MMKRLWSVGHSTRTLEEYISLLKHYGIERLVDVRTVPKSRTNPQFNREMLEVTIPDAGIEYIYKNDLGGLRRSRKDSVNTGWRNDTFRGFADYMETPEFEEAISELVRLTEEKPTAIMCAEVLPWRCHRSLIGDAITVRGFEVMDIFDEKHAKPHKLTPFARVEGEKITYPAEG